MCNTKNTETIRQQLWFDVVIRNTAISDCFKLADEIVAEFDKRFNDKLACKNDAPFNFATSIGGFKNNQDSFE